jgi:hypothetical protein
MPNITISLDEELLKSKAPNINERTHSEAFRTDR